jgi:S1-C subfamily serine protease
MSKHFGRRACLSGIGASALLAGAGAARADVEYSSIDRATVRVISLGGVKTIRLKTQSGKNHRLAMPEVGHGSGILITNQGLILTAHHVIHGARSVAVRVPGSRKAYPAEIAYNNKDRDFAFLVIPDEAAHVLPLPEQAPRLQVRQTIFAVGYPFDVKRPRPQSTRGIVSGVLPGGQLQLGIAVNPGNSGGPVIDENDRLVGLLVARGDPRRGVHGIGVAVPLDAVTEVFRRIVEDGRAFSKARNRALAADDRAWARAELTAALAESGSTLGMVREATAAAEGEKSGDILRSLRAALKTAPGDADTHVLAGAYYWNAAHVLMELRHGQWEDTLSRAKKECREALKQDRKVLERSPFVKTALGD